MTINIFLTIWSILCLTSILLMCLRYDYQELYEDFCFMFAGLRLANIVLLLFAVYVALPFNIFHSVIQLIKQYKNKK